MNTLGMIMLGTLVANMVILCFCIQALVVVKQSLKNVRRMRQEAQKFERQLIALAMREGRKNRRRK